jgi:single-strand DNA-binding protein
MTNNESNDLYNLQNNVNIIGDLIKDPDLKHTKTGKLVCSFVIKNGSTNPTYVPVVAWGDQAMKCNDLKEGISVHVKGRLQTNSWKGTDGVRISRLRVVASKIELCSKLEKINVKQIQQMISQGIKQEMPF